MFDVEFTTVPYVKGSQEPPNFSHLLQHTTEKATDNQEQLSRKFFYPSSNVEYDQVDSGESNLQGTSNIMEDTNNQVDTGVESTLGTSNNTEDKNIEVGAGKVSTLGTEISQAHKAQGE